MNKLLLTLTLLIVLIGCGGSRTSRLMNPVTRVVDGDTVVFDTYKAKKLKGRLLGIDTPESVHPRKPVEPYALEATAFVKKWIAENDEWVEYINKLDDKDGKDRYGRSLIWIISDKSVLNVEIVRRGLGRAKFYGNKHLIYTLELMLAEKEAKAKKIGIWSSRRP